MADSSVNTGSSGSPIRVLTGLGSGVADQQVVSLADQYGNLFPSDPDGTLSVDDGSSNLAFDAFDGTLTAQWTPAGSVVPTQGAGSLTFNAGTTASATSYISSINPLPLQAEAYLHTGWVLSFDTNAALTNSTRWWGYGQNQASPSATAPVLNGAVFMFDYAAGAFYAAIYSAGTRTQTVTLTKPTDGVPHRFQIQLRTTRAYFLMDSLVVATIQNPNPAAINNLFLIAGQANYTTGPSSNPTLIVSTASAADSQENNTTISDATYASVRATVKKSSTPATLTDTGLAVDIRQNGSLNSTYALSSATSADGVTILDGYQGVRVGITGTFSATYVFEQSPDGVTFSAVSVYNQSYTLLSGSSSTNQLYFAPLIARYFRVRTSVWTSGTVNVTIQYTTAPPTLAQVTLQGGSNSIGGITNISTAVTPGTSAANLGKAQANTPTSTDTGVAVLGVRAPTTPVARTATAGNYALMLLDAEGKIVVSGTADPAVSWQAVASQTTTTAVSLHAAQASSIRNYLTDLTISNASATATLATVLDGSTVIWEAWIGAGSSATMNFSTPLRGTAATAMNVNSSVAVTTLYFSATGYAGI